MKSIEANIADVIHKKIYPARIFFDKRIQSIEPLSEPIEDRFVLPGLVDAHVHIESSMLPPSEFARMAVRHGTWAAVSDPHEIANVSGIDGIVYMIANADTVPFKFIFGAPSCVPATKFETDGASITDKDIDDLFRTEKLNYLSEMMNFPGVLHCDPEIMAKIDVAKKYGKQIDGHAPGLSGESLLRYAESGVATDHECTTIEEAEEKIRYGMKILIREGSAAKNFDLLCPLIDKYPDMIMLCTDDLHPDDLVRGHINQLLARGVEKGLDLFSLLRAATVNPANHYQIDLGLVQKNDPADFIIVNNLKDFNVLQSFSRGICVFDGTGEKLTAEAFSNSREFEVKPAILKLPDRFNASKIAVPDVQIIAASDEMKVIQVFDGGLFTKQRIDKVKKGCPIVSDIDRDILKIVVLNRYQPAKPSVAFVNGFGLKQGALVSTVAHDSHHIIAVGCDDYSIIKVINHIIDLKGGLAAINEQHLIDLRLDIAGLMSSRPAEEVACVYERLNRMASCMGSALTSPFMTLSFMSLLVIPELKLGDKGLFDVSKFEWTSLF